MTDLHEDARQKLMGELIKSNLEMRDLFREHTQSEEQVRDCVEGLRKTIGALIKAVEAISRAVEEATTNSPKKTP